VGPDLRKAQGESEFFFLHFCRKFFNFFKEKLWLMSNIQALLLGLDKIPLLAIMKTRN
jgi:hypothetical protein